MPIRMETRDAVAWATIDRPEVLNALDIAHLEELLSVVRRAGDTFFYNLASETGQYALALIFGISVLAPLFPALHPGFGCRAGAASGRLRQGEAQIGALALQLGRLKDEGKFTFAQVSMAKRNNVRKALEVARIARTILGGNGISGEYQSMRHMCNLETVDTYEGTYEIHTLIVGQALSGEAAYE